jgi:hypothetical protein
MNFNQAQVNAETTVQSIISKCWEDEAFKQELISNPAQGIEKLSGKPFDLKGKKLVIVDQTDTSTVYINIPANREDMELSENELEGVAGGAGSCNWLYYSLIG